ncbi:MAG TPA: DUF3175 domain-containing protein [Reyranella sp.]|nr:DUF3175 domain-containing protein [Reyranella sp.]
MGKPASPGKKWSARVTRESHALALDKGEFSQRSPGAIARSLKRSAERSRARKSVGQPAQDAGSGQGRAAPPVRQAKGLTPDTCQIDD